MPLTVSLGEEAHALGDVDRVVADPLVVAGDERELDGDGDTERSAHELGGEAHVQLVELVVDLDQLVGGLLSAIAERDRGAAPHLDADAAHLADEAAHARRQLGREAASRSGGDVLGEVVAALELGDDAQDRDEEAQVRRHRRLQRELVLHQRLHVLVELVDELIARDEGLGGLAVTRQERVRRARQPFGYVGEQAQCLVLDRLQVAVVGDA